MASKETKEIVNVVGPFQGLPGIGRLREAEKSETDEIKAQLLDPPQGLPGIGQTRNQKIRIY